LDVLNLPPGIAPPVTAKQLVVEMGGFDPKHHSPTGWSKHTIGIIVDALAGLNYHQALSFWLMYTDKLPWFVAAVAESIASGNPRAKVPTRVMLPVSRAVSDVGVRVMQEKEIHDALDLLSAAADACETSLGPAWKAYYKAWAEFMKHEAASLYVFRAREDTLISCDGESGDIMDVDRDGLETCLRTFARLTPECAATFFLAHGSMVKECLMRAFRTGVLVPDGVFLNLLSQSDDFLEFVIQADWAKLMKLWEEAEHNTSSKAYHRYLMHYLIMFTAEMAKDEAGMDDKSAGMLQKVLVLDCRLLERAVRALRGLSGGPLGAEGLSPFEAFLLVAAQIGDEDNKLFQTVAEYSAYVTTVLQDRPITNIRAMLRFAPVTTFSKGLPDVLKFAREHPDEAKDLFRRLADKGALHASVFQNNIAALGIAAKVMQAYKVPFAGAVAAFFDATGATYMRARIFAQNFLRSAQTEFSGADSERLLLEFVETGQHALSEFIIRGLYDGMQGLRGNLRMLPDAHSERLWALQGIKTRTQLQRKSGGGYGRGDRDRDQDRSRFRSRSRSRSRSRESMAAIADERALETSSEDAALDALASLFGSALAL